MKGELDDILALYLISEMELEEDHHHLTDEERTAREEEMDELLLLAAVLEQDIRSRDERGYRT